MPGRRRGRGSTTRASGLIASAPPWPAFLPAAGEARARPGRAERTVTVGPGVGRGSAESLLELARDPVRQLLEVVVSSRPCSLRLAMVTRRRSAWVWRARDSTALIRAPHLLLVRLEPLSAQLHLPVAAALCTWRQAGHETRPASPLRGKQGIDAARSFSRSSWCRPRRIRRKPPAPDTCTLRTRAGTCRFERPGGEAALPSRCVSESPASSCGPR